MPQNFYREGGFTAVELLITLIIASMFLFSGYQLYTQVTRDGAEANRTATVSSLTTAKLQETSRSLSGNCAASSSTPAAINQPGIGSIQYTITVSCPNSANIPSLKLVKVEASYDSPVKKVTHASYVR